MRKIHIEWRIHALQKETREQIHQSFRLAKDYTETTSKRFGVDLSACRSDGAFTVRGFLSLASTHSIHGQRLHRTRAPHCSDSLGSHDNDHDICSQNRPEVLASNSRNDTTKLDKKKLHKTGNPQFWFTGCRHEGSTQIYTHRHFHSSCELFAFAQARQSDSKLKRKTLNCCCAEQRGTHLDDFPSASLPSLYPLSTVHFRMMSSAQFHTSSHTTPDHSC